MKHFFLITNSKKDPNCAMSNDIAQYIIDKGGSASVMDHNEAEPKDVPKNTECIIVLGGDGTMIRVSTRMESLGIPVIGVNLGNLGYLCELERNTIYPAIDQLFDDDYLLENRMMLKNTGGCDQAVHLALNDIFFTSAGEQKFIHLNVYVNGAKLNTYHADGIIVSTPTGSTGYNLSAGGPIVNPKAELILLTPINDHNLSSRSIALDRDDIVEVELDSRRDERDEKATVSVDGDQVYTMCVGERYQIGRARETVLICRLSRIGFLENLRKKMEQ
ncbi:MAG: NAD(+)/NADH kinase [Lachnospiraceae bacterium]|nr:NAD(+)/NADH kinase [Lachnospiraceae bacterium]